MIPVANGISLRLAVECQYQFAFGNDAYIICIMRV